MAHADGLPPFAEGPGGDVTALERAHALEGDTPAGATHYAVERPDTPPCHPSDTGGLGGKLPVVPQLVEPRR